MSLNEADCEGTFIQGRGLSVLIKCGKSCFWWLLFEDDNLLLIEPGLGERGKMGLKRILFCVLISHHPSQLRWEQEGNRAGFSLERVWIQVVIALLQHLLAKVFCWFLVFFLHSYTDAELSVCVVLIYGYNLIKPLVKEMSCILTSAAGSRNNKL